MKIIKIREGLRKTDEIGTTRNVRLFAPRCFVRHTNLFQAQPGSPVCDGQNRVCRGMCDIAIAIAVGKVNLKTQRRYIPVRGNCWRGNWRVRRDHLGADDGTGYL